MTIATMNKENINSFFAMQQEAAWFTKIEKSALSSLDDDFRLDQFDSDLRAIKPKIIFNNNETKIFSDQIKKQVSCHAWKKSMKKQKVIINVLPFFLNDYYFAYSLWWTEGSELVSPSLLICKRLPSFEGIAAMLDGNWQKWGWEGSRYPLEKQGKDETKK